MAGVFDDEEIEQVAPRHDTELTLGTTALLLIFFGLLALCGLCFGMGYSMGHHGSQENAAALPSAAIPAAHTDSGRTKPSANAEASAATRPSPPANQEGSSLSGTSARTSAASGAGGASSGSSNSVQPAQPASTKPAFGNAASPVQAEVPTSTVRPAIPAAASLMVQIAAVSQPEDADVLVSALRKRGYAVAAHRDALDGLIHVRIGPFKTRDEADTWRQKLLNDGYNAIVQP
jgi:cell division septation protein DedD